MRYDNPVVDEQTSDEHYRDLNETLILLIRDVGFPDINKSEFLQNEFLRLEQNKKQ